MGDALTFTELMDMFSELLRLDTPVVINGKSYGLVDGHPETHGIYTAYMRGYYDSQTSQYRF